MKTILLILTVALLLQGCTNSSRLRGSSDAIKVSFENMARQIKKEGEDTHKANRIKYVKGGKKEILQAAMAALLELGFHINNQDFSLGVLSATASRDSTFLDEAVHAAERRHRQKIVNVLKDGYREQNDQDMIVSAIVSQMKEELNTISINVIVMERKLDNQVSLRVTYTVSPYVSPEPAQIIWGVSARELLTMYIREGYLQGDEYPKYTLPPSTLTLIYKRFWDTTEKQLFQQNIILNR